MTYHVLLTGHEGYVGNKLQDELLKRDVIVGTFKGDLLDIDWENKPKQFDMVVHLAGLAGVRRSFREPKEYYKNNVELSRRIFKYCERTRTEVMYASSSNAHEWWLNPYATTKQMIEEMASMLTVRHIGMRFHTVWPGRTDMLYERLRRNEVDYINADHFRDYILEFIFYKYLSEKIVIYANKILEADNIKFEEIDDKNEQNQDIIEAIKEDAITQIGYFLNPSDLFNKIANRNNFILEDLPLIEFKYSTAFETWLFLNSSAEIIASLSQLENVSDIDLGKLFLPSFVAFSFKFILSSICLTLTFVKV